VGEVTVRVGHEILEQVANPENRIELTTERDALGMPRVRTTWHVDAAEERTHRRSLEILLAQLERIEPGISAARLDSDPWPRDIVGTWHHVGATRMSGDPATGVVDADARVHGIDNLHIVGSSVFSVSASTSPTVAIVELAHRLGDHLAQRRARPAPMASPSGAAEGSVAESPQIHGTSC